MVAVRKRAFLPCERDFPPLGPGLCGAIIHWTELSLSFEILPPKGGGAGGEGRDATFWCVSPAQSWCGVGDRWKTERVERMIDKSRKRVWCVSATRWDGRRSPLALAWSNERIRYTVGDNASSEDEHHRKYVSWSGGLRGRNYWQMLSLVAKGCRRMGMRVHSWGEWVFYISFLYDCCFLSWFMSYYSLLEVNMNVAIWFLALLLLMRDEPNSSVGSQHIG